MKINRLKITDFKSIDSLTLSHITNFSVFAGANGSGKTTIFQALDFVGHIFRQGLSQTLREFGGYDNVHSHKRRAANAAIFSFDIEVEIKQVIFHYALKAELMREESKNTIIWINTHSESIVRTARYDELLLVDKVDGKTLITHAKKINGSLSMSDAWLSNMFKGGLPW